MKKIIFSGIQPTGISPHLGNYLGALRQWVDLQNDHEAYYCVVDLHALTVQQDVRHLHLAIYQSYALLLAIGIDLQKSVLFVQSHNQNHTELAWLLNCYTHFGELNRMTQFKEKSEKQKQIISAGLYGYPVLMAADILLYGTDVVPVGEDQTQHVELTRNIAERFNNQYGETFKLPMIRLVKEAARVMSLQEPTKKMSKSDENQNSTVYLLDDKDTIMKKIRGAVTDSQTGIVFDENRPGLFNLLNIYKVITNKENHEIESYFSNKNYGQLKTELAEIVVNYLAPIQKRYQELISDKVTLKKYMIQNALKARAVSEKKLKEVKEKIGLVL